MKTSSHPSPARRRTSSARVRKQHAAHAAAGAGAGAGAGASSASSSSSSSSSSPPPPPPSKKFACQVGGCGRSFTRSEHLQRHLLNHTAGQSTCERCRAHFKRKDLLERHMARHRQKDEEAGAEGEGILNTRKRMWKDADGNIVTKRPALGSQSSRTSSRPPQSQAASSDGGKADQPKTPLNPEAPISPPISTSTSDSHGFPHAEDQAPAFSVESLWSFQHPLAVNHDPVPPLHAQPSPDEQERFWSAGLNNSSAFQEAIDEDVPYETIFNPDTASSFNMPFTTMNNYNWLFDLDLGASAQQLSTSVDLVNRPFQASPVDIAISNQPMIHHYPGSVPSEFPRTCGDLALLTNAVPHATLEHSASAAPAPTATTLQTSEPPLSTSCTLSTEHDITSVSHAAPNSASIARGPGHAQGPQTPTPKPPVSLANVERPLSMLSRSSSLPIIDEIARAQVLAVVHAARPATPDGGYVTRDHPLLSLSSLQTYCDLYFTRFNTAYPLIHQATFDASHVETLLLISILLIGATYCEKDAHQLAVCIHDVLRPQIFAHASFNARPAFWVLQTILLVECFGKSRAGQKQHDMSHLFHGLLINLIRRSDCQTIRPPSVDDGSDDLEDDWRTWAEAEQKKRLALLCFMWDTQHAVLFCQSLCMSAFELRTTLPCDQPLWEAASAEQWQQVRKRQEPPPLFLTCLKNYLTPGAQPLPKHMNALSRVILLHGLMSISWDMKRRDQTSLGMMGNGTVLGNWRARLGSSYDAWRADFDDYCISYTTSVAHDSPTIRREFTCFTVATNAIYHAAHVLLNAELLDLQIYAGARHILGRPVARPDYVRSQRVVKRWATEEVDAAGKAAWHAACLLRDGLTGLEDFDAGGLFHYPWCLYLATLTCWAWHHARPVMPVSAASAPAATAAASDPDAEGESVFDDEDEIVWDAKGEMHELIAGMTSIGWAGLAAAAAAGSGLPAGARKRTSGLTAVVAKSLSKVRWAVVHDGMMVLKGLVPWRLINQAEAWI